MANLVIFHDEDYCMDCNTEHSLFVYDVFNIKTPISKMIKDKSFEPKRELEYIKCNNCDREYNIDWTSDSRLPKQMSVNIKLNQFLREFRQNSKYINYR